MNKSICLICLSCFLVHCGQKQADVERVVEDGVEVVINHLEPYQIEGETTLSLEQEYVLDLERENLAELGMSDVLGFDVDSDGYIYFWCLDSSENFIYRFDSDGNFVNSFGRKGQGPGEFGQPMNLRINDAREVVVSDEVRSKIVFFNPDGELLREIDLEERIVIATQLSNGNLLQTKGVFNPDTGYTQLPVILSKAESDEAQELQQGQKMPNWIRAPEINGLDTVRKICTWGISNGLIYIDNLEKGYEFLVYDFDGQLLRKIRKEYAPVAIPQGFKDVILSIFDRPVLQKYKVKEKVFFPDYMPPFQYYFTDDESRLFVMTCEKGLNSNEYIYDIFNSDGYFIGRTSLDNFSDAVHSVRPMPLPASAKHKKLYYLRGKESGYYELVVCMMNWQ